MKNTLTGIRVEGLDVGLFEHMPVPNSRKSVPKNREEPVSPYYAIGRLEGYAFQLEAELAVLRAENARQKSYLTKLKYLLKAQQYKTAEK